MERCLKTFLNKLYDIFEHNENYIPTLYPSSLNKSKTHKLTWCLNELLQKLSHFCGGKQTDELTVIPELWLSNPGTPWLLFLRFNVKNSERATRHRGKHLYSSNRLTTFLLSREECIKDDRRSYADPQSDRALNKTNSRERESMQKHNTHLSDARRYLKAFYEKFP